MQSQKWQSDLCSFPRQTIQYHGDPSLCPANNAEEAEVGQFYENLQDILELIPKKDVLFIIGDWNAKVGSQETPGVTGKFVLGVWNEAGQRLIEFCQQNALVIANTFFQQHKRSYHYPDIKIGQRYYQKRKLPANILDEYRCKSPHKILANWIQQYT